MELEFKNRLDGLVTELTTIDIKETDTVMMLIENGTDVGFIVFDNHYSMMRKLEIFIDHRGKGYGLSGFTAFLKAVKPYNEYILLRARNRGLLNFYKKFGFNNICGEELKMRLDF